MLPILALVTCGILLTQQSADTWIRTGILLIVGLLLYGLTRIVSARRLASSQVN